MLHILDLAIYFDCYSSSFLTWTDDASIFEGRSRDERLLKLYRNYLDWCGKQSLDCQDMIFPLDSHRKNMPMPYAFCKAFGVQNPTLFSDVFVQEFRNPKWISCQTTIVFNEHPPKIWWPVPFHWAEETQWCCKQDADPMGNCYFRCDFQGSPIKHPQVGWNKGFLF